MTVITKKKEKGKERGKKFLVNQYTSSSHPLFIFIFKSSPFCRRMGLQDRVLPFSLALFLTSSMTHADAAKVQVGFGKVNYLWPCFAGDTFTKTFTVESIRNTSDGNHSVSIK
jgi:hypothetical protein